MSTAATVLRIEISQERTPKRRLRMNTPATIEPERPVTSPMKVNQPASFRMSWYTEPRLAPRAIRTPISRVRWSTPDNKSDKSLIDVRRRIYRKNGGRPKADVRFRDFPGL